MFQGYYYYFQYLGVYLLFHAPLVRQHLIQFDE